ncbi:hypothetical protein KVR01_013553 [Diaporthe batatas]|uniref:uncharacterized protein n=1 Tax=Diaporthe batatas TaxID=748121 RepID=UPI001D048EA0|nr:uncharacterized protein KVR01_013553 [Diaporthe batatas]KAG8156602.1 hypothetical protein KVR01_013553 [Diaporthe batatas]
MGVKPMEANSVASLLVQAYKLREHFNGSIAFSIYEKSPDLGGTWFENKYPGSFCTCEYTSNEASHDVTKSSTDQGFNLTPGCACDVPSHIYQYPFALNPSWSQFYASSDEIQAYLKRFAGVHGLEQFIHFNSKVIEARWSENLAKWNVTIDGMADVIQSEILVNAGGILNNPKLPSIPGFSSFAGQHLHTASWDSSVKLDGKRVAVIGAGASAVQLLPQIQPLCSQVDVYIRTPSWITAPAGITLADAENMNPVYSIKDMERFASDEDAYLETRKELENYFNGNFLAYFKKTPEQKDLKAQFESRMRELIIDKTLQEKLIPSFEAGCRRINPGEQYLVALQEPNVHANFDPIEKITATGVVVSGGVEHAADVLIAATGFDTTFRPRFPIIGRDGLNLQDVWRSDPASYMGIGVAGFPNYLTFLGPNTPISNGSLMEGCYDKGFGVSM